jgi:threonine/homoserine/homoserine lactone efflux protein
MTAAFLLKGVVLGFSIAAPVGPIGVLCIRRSLADGRAAGLVTGLGAATADAMYGGVAAFGLTAVSGFLVAQKFWLGLFGGLFLCYLGVRTFAAAPKDQPAASRGGGLAAAYGSTLVLTLTNPMTILSFVAIFAGLGVGAAADYTSAAALVAGVFLGSALWWLFLSNGIAMVGSRLTGGWLRVVNHVSGAIIFAFGFYSIASAFRR